MGSYMVRYGRGCWVGGEGSLQMGEQTSVMILSKRLKALLSLCFLQNFLISVSTTVTSIYSLKNSVEAAPLENGL